MESTAKKSSGTRKSRPATTPEAREKEMIALAMDRVEQRIREDKASSAELCHFLKLATTNAALEKEKLENENLLLKAKTSAIQSQEEIKEMYNKALSAMKRYQGSDSEDEFDD